MPFLPLFISPESCSSNGQLLGLTVVYGYILYQGSQLISAGSELLQLFPSVALLVGSIILPILGAVPDGMMVLFSGLGPREEAQVQVAVGVGALAGSTVMLLTFPWFIAIIFGRAPMDEDGKVLYGKEKDVEGGTKELRCMDGGIAYADSLKKTSTIMLATTLLFLVIQIPASLEEKKDPLVADQAKHETSYAALGLILCIIAFFIYLWICMKDANEDKALAKVIEAIKSRQMSIGAALKFAKETNPSTDTKEPLMDAAKVRLKKIVQPFFAHYDVDGSRTLDISEFKSLLHELGEREKHNKPCKELLQQRDKNKDGMLDLGEVVDFLAEYLNEDKLEQVPGSAAKLRASLVGGGEEEEEAEEMPEDLADLEPKMQFRWLLWRSCYQMGLGTLLVLIFSDPMVDVLSEWGNRLDISPFYISFVLAPFASNASELLSAYTYARKQSTKSITCALSTLVGAACMNNTFCLAIFFALVYFQGLAWTFTAEVIAIILIQWVIGLMTIVKKNQTVVDAFIILGCYPGCLLVVMFLEYIGYD